MTVWVIYRFHNVSCHIIFPCLFESLWSITFCAFALFYTSKHKWDHAPQRHSKSDNFTFKFKEQSPETLISVIIYSSPFRWKVRLNSVVHKTFLEQNAKYRCSFSQPAEVDWASHCLCGIIHVCGRPKIPKWSDRTISTPLMHSQASAHKLDVVRTNSLASTAMILARKGYK